MVAFQTNKFNHLALIQPALTSHATCDAESRMTSEDTFTSMGAILIAATQVTSTNKLVPALLFCIFFAT